MKYKIFYYNNDINYILTIDYIKYFFIKKFLSNIYIKPNIFAFLNVKNHFDLIIIKNPNKKFFYNIIKYHTTSLCIFITNLNLNNKTSLITINKNFLFKIFNNELLPFLKECHSYFIIKKYLRLLSYKKNLLYYNTLLNVQKKNTKFFYLFNNFNYFLIFNYLKIIQFDNHVFLHFLYSLKMFLKQTLKNILNKYYINIKKTIIYIWLNNKEKNINNNLLIQLILKKIQQIYIILTQIKKNNNNYFDIYTIIFKKIIN